MSSSNDAYWLGLRRVPGVGPRTARLPLDKFESPQAIFEAPVEAIGAAGVSSRVARAISGFRDFEPLEKELCELPRIGARLVRWTDPDYPPNLRQIPDPPPYLFVRGSGSLNETRMIAVVGARAASEGARRMAERLGLELAAKGFVVVSGLARGTDGAAHQGALDGGGCTIAVLGSGIDVIYPPEHQKLADSIIEKGGALLSELPVGTQPLGEHFPARNRILSGLSLGVVVVEAAEKSGSLITARMALEQNRQVFAVPGSPLTGKTRGSNRLIRDGAILIECVEDVIEELAPQLGRVTPPTAKVPAQQPRSTSPEVPSSRGKAGKILLETPDQTLNDAKCVVMQLKDSERLHVDAIIEGSGLDARTVLRLLLELELKGIVAQHPGKLFSLA